MKQETAIPLCVDLDGTLVKLDTLYQAIFMLLRRNPLCLFRLPGWIAKGRAYLKEQVMAQVEIDATTLPYNAALLEYLREQHQSGRKLILATASNIRTAQAVADHLGIFSEVMASDATTNLKAEAKLAAIQQKYPTFAYVGNSEADFPLWEAAEEIFLANPSNRAKQKFADRADYIFNERKPLLPQLLKAIRAHQWIKNLLIFSPMFLAHEFNECDKLLSATAAFLSFSFAASTIYVINDLFDLSADQHHPRKCRRPFASGALPIESGMLLIPLLAILSLLFSRSLPPTFLGTLLLYFLITITYSWRLKQIAIIDVLSLAVLYTLRIIAGAQATQTHASGWFINFAIFFFVSLALVKRLSELLEIKQSHQHESSERERGYTVPDLPLLMTFGATSGYIAVFVFTRYLNSEKVEALYSRPELLWLFTPLLLYWITRIWLLAWRGEMKDDPLAFAATDFQTYIIGMLSLAVIIFAI